MDQRENLIIDVNVRASVLPSFTLVCTEPLVDRQARQSKSMSHIGREFGVVHWNDTADTTSQCK